MGTRWGWRHQHNGLDDTCSKYTKSQQHEVEFTEGEQCWMRLRDEDALEYPMRSGHRAQESPGGSVNNYKTTPPLG